MGSDRFYPEERPRRHVRVDGFWIDETPVTNRQFAAFVAATGYRTLAETPPNPVHYPGMPPEMARAGSLVFQPPQGAVDLDDFRQSWQFQFDANWMQPLGEGSSVAGLEDHPVVHIACADAEAYAAWAGKSLPTEAEWEYAARAGLDAEFAWGDEVAPEGRMLANYWQGEFPRENRMLDGWERTSPVRSFPANAFGLYDMIGNVWEWTASPFAKYPLDPTTLFTPPSDPTSTRVTRGSSWLSLPDSIEASKRLAEPPSATSKDLGFRCVVSADQIPGR